jgi:hypothetical protein
MKASEEISHHETIDGDHDDVEEGEEQQQKGRERAGTHHILPTFLPITSFYFDAVALSLYRGVYSIHILRRLCRKLSSFLLL